MRQYGYGCRNRRYISSVKLHSLVIFWFISPSISNDFIKYLFFILQKKFFFNFNFFFRLYACQLQQSLLISQKNIISENHMQAQNHQVKVELLFDPIEQQIVGIQQYIVKGKQIPAITKYMLSDFIVNQIDVNQNVVVVQNKPLSIKFQQQKKKINYQMTKQLFQDIQKNLSLQAAKQIQSLYENLQSGQRVLEWQFIIENVSNQKTQRLKIHNFVRQKLQNIESNTLDGNKIRLKFNRKLKKMDPASRHKYIHFKLFKSNIDTMGALFKLSKITGISHKIFSSAGLKDKRGITTQKVSVFNSDLNNLKRFYGQAERNRQMWIDGFELNKDDAIAVGCLFGNQFGLILRLLKAQDAQQIHQRVQCIKKFGIINYFGMQRFGSCATRTHMIGVKIIRKQWKQLVQDLLLQDTGNSNLNNMKRQLYESKQYRKGQQSLGNRYKIQKSLFQGLAKHGNNYYNVFQNLSRSIKTLYCHALQSYLWNKITSRRIRQFGLEKLVVGDLVGIKSNSKNNQNQTIKQQDVKPAQIEQQDNKKQTKQELNEQLNEQQDDIDEQQVEIIKITQENISKYTIFELVAPLYGISIDLPQTSLMNKYLIDQLTILKLYKHDFSDKSKSLCFKGAYRKCIIKPPMVQCEIISHKLKRAQLLSPFYMKGQKLTFQQGDLKSAKIVIQLPKSSYATIAIRQILHIPSSFKVQQKLNGLYDNL